MKKGKRTQIFGTIRIAIYGFFLISLILLVSAVRSNQELRSRAAGEPARTVRLAPPSLYLSAEKRRFDVGETVPVSVLVNTANVPSVETRIVVTFDPTILALAKDTIRTSDVYHSVNIEKLEKGRLEASFFVIPEAGYAPVSLPSDTTIVTIPFTVISARISSTDINLLYNGIDPELSGIFVQVDRSQGGIRNILRSTGGVSISISP